MGCVDRHTYRSPHFLMHSCYTTSLCVFHRNSHRHRRISCLTRNAHGLTAIFFCFFLRTGVSPAISNMAFSFAVLPNTAPTWYKRWVVLRGDNVNDEEGCSAVFTEQGASASQMAAAKFLDTISKLPGLVGETSDANSPHSQVKMTEALRLLRLPLEVCPEIWIRIGPRQKKRESLDKIENHLVHLEWNFFGHPCGGLLWESQIFLSQASAVCFHSPRWSKCQRNLFGRRLGRTCPSLRFGRSPWQRRIGTTLASTDHTASCFLDEARARRWPGAGGLAVRSVCSHADCGYRVSGRQTKATLFQEYWALGQHRRESMESHSPEGL